MHAWCAHGDMVPAYGREETGNLYKRLARPTLSNSTWFCEARSGFSRLHYFFRRARIPRVVPTGHESRALWHPGLAMP
jgi:hypothetical protein